MYIWVSNDSEVPVYFDDLAINHRAGPLLQEDDYYPFGLEMKMLGSRAAGKQENKKMYNAGSEMQNKEFSDGTGLELYATQFRSLDPQLGRWWQIDPKPDYSQSLYASMGNNPVSFNDPLGDTLRISFQGGFLGLKTREVNYNNGSLTNKDGSAYGGKVKGFLKKSVNALNKINGTTDGSRVVSSLQSSTNSFTVKDAALNPNKDADGVGKTQFVPDNNKKEYGVALTATGSPRASLGGSGGTIYFDPSGSSGAVPVQGGGTDLNHITNLAHEMFHGYEANFGMTNNDDVLGTGLGRHEYRASFFENQIRSALRAPLRSEYWFRNAAGNQGIAPILNLSGQPIYVPPTTVPPALNYLNINLIY